MADTPDETLGDTGDTGLRRSDPFWLNQGHTPTPWLDGETEKTERDWKTQVRITAQDMLRRFLEEHRRRPFWAGSRGTSAVTLPPITDQERADFIRYAMDEGASLSEAHAAAMAMPIATARAEPGRYGLDLSKYNFDPEPVEPEQPAWSPRSADELRHTAARKALDRYTELGYKWPYVPEGGSSGGSGAALSREEDAKRSFSPPSERTIGEKNTWEAFRPLPEK